jgi:ADP-heptose:LPS heptosyltransferase
LFKNKFLINKNVNLTFSEELMLISHLDGMISMDSANMHLASIYGVPVVSIWGATHPFLGFYGYGQDPERIVQAELFCRPCSVFGNKPCYRGDFACMKMIEPQTIIDKTEKVLN